MTVPFFPYLSGKSKRVGGTEIRSFRETLTITSRVSRWLCLYCITAYLCLFVPTNAGTMVTWILPHGSFTTAPDMDLRIRPSTTELVYRLRAQQVGYHSKDGRLRGFPESAWLGPRTHASATGQWSDRGFRLKTFSSRGPRSL